MARPRKAPRASRRPSRARRAEFHCGVCGRELRVSADDLAAIGAVNEGEACRCTCGLLVCSEHSVIPGLEVVAMNPKDHAKEEHLRPASSATLLLAERLELALRSRSPGPVQAGPSRPAVPQVDPLAYVHLVNETVRMRIAAGHHPDDVMLDASAMLETYTRVYVGGEWPRSAFEASAQSEQR